LIDDLARRMLPVFVIDAHPRRGGWWPQLPRRSGRRERAGGGIANLRVQRPLPANLHLALPAALSPVSEDLRRQARDAKLFFADLRANRAPRALYATMTDDVFVHANRRTERAGKCVRGHYAASTCARLSQCGALAETGTPASSKAKTVGSVPRPRVASMNSCRL